MATIAKATAPITQAERIHWAEVRVIDTARLVVSHAHDDSLKLALTARLQELDASIASGRSHSSGGSHAAQGNHRAK